MVRLTPAIRRQPNMPGTTNVSANVKEMYEMKRHPSESSEPSVAAHRSRAQMIAIAESQARVAEAKGHSHHMHRAFHGSKEK